LTLITQQERNRKVQISIEGDMGLGENNGHSFVWSQSERSSLDSLTLSNGGLRHSRLEVFLVFLSLTSLPSTF